MSANRNYGTQGVVTNAGRRIGQGKDAIRVAIQYAKEALLFEHVNGAGEHGRLLRLALNEAEGLAWQTEFPHLFFPELAREKAQAAVAWHQRQLSLRHGVAEVAFAE